MANLNKVLLIGNLTRDPELRYTPGGMAVGEFGLAVSRKFKDRNTNEMRDDVCFVDVTAWGKTGEICCEYLTKGSPVFLEGRLQFDSWEGQDGQKRSKLRVVAENVQFLGRRGVGGKGDDDAQENAPPPAKQAPASAPPRGGESEVVDDEVPF